MAAVLDEAMGGCAWLQKPAFQVLINANIRISYPTHTHPPPHPTTTHHHTHLLTPLVLHHLRHVLNTMFNMFYTCAVPNQCAATLLRVPRPFRA